MYDNPDYSTFETTAGENLTPIRAIYLSSTAIGSGQLSDISTVLSARNANALILEMKNPSGMLSWASGVTLATSYGTNGTDNLTAKLAELKESGIYLVARISCNVDDLMATRNTPLALATVEGRAFSTSAGHWLDPTNSAVRAYVAELANELIAMGFDEIMLADFEHPTLTAGTALAYSQSGTFEMTPEIIISGFATTLRTSVEDRGAKLSVLCNTASFRNGQHTQTGQSPELFGKVFDRYYWPTDSSALASDMELVAQSIPRESLANRFVPIMFDPGASESWVYPQA